MVKPKSPRDEFPKKVVRTLRDAVDGRCSNPTCDVATGGPGTVPGTSHSIGKAAHISAAAIGGPRYEPEMTAEDRSSYNNGIWLCSNCADWIDRDVNGHRKELLWAWKRDAENRARERRGKPQPQAEDVMRQAALLQGNGGPPLNQLSHAIQLAHQGTARYLEKLDPQFKVSSEFHNGHPLFFLQPVVEPVNVDFTLSGPRLRDYAMQFQDYVEHGETFNVATEDVRFEGSPLLAELTREAGGTLSFGPHTRQASHTCDSTLPGVHLEPFIGDLTHGTASLSFAGFSCDGMMKLAYQRMDPSTSRVDGLSVRLDLTRWRGQDIRNLPYLDSLLNFYRTTHEQGSLRTSLNIEGRRAFGATLRVQEMAKVDFENLYLFFRYTALCQQIAYTLGLSIRFVDTVAFSEALINRLEEVHRLLQGELIEKPLESEPVLIDLEFSTPDDPLLLECNRESGAARFLMTTGETISLFETIVPLPQLKLTFTEVVPRVVKKYQANGKSVATMLLDLQPECRCVWHYESGEDEKGLDACTMASATIDTGLASVPNATKEGL